MKFEVKEDTAPRYSDKYEEFIELYNDKSVSVLEIRRMLDWSGNIFNQARDKAVSENRIRLRSNGGHKNKVKPLKSVPKYYSQHIITGKYSVRKMINGRTVYFGSYDSEDTVKEVVKRLKQVDWDINEYPTIKRECIDKYGK